MEEQKETINSEEKTINGLDPVLNSQQKNIEQDKKNFVTPEIVNEWKVWAAKQSYSIGTTMTYYSFLKKFVGYGIEINQKKVDNFREDIKNRSSGVAGAIKSLIEFLVSKKEYDQNLNLIKFKRLKKENRKVPKTISQEEVKKLIENMPDVKTRIMTYLIYELALRISESLKLVWSDFNWYEWLQDRSQFGKVTLRNTKGNKFRVLPVKPELMNTLYEAHTSRTQTGIPIGNNIFDLGDGLLSFISGVKKDDVEVEKYHYIDVAKRYYREILYNVSKTQLDKKVSPHMLRHSKAQFLLDSGMPLESIKELLGHSSISTTEIYAQASPEKVKKDLIKYDTPANN